MNFNRPLAEFAGTLPDSNIHLRGRPTQRIASSPCRNRLFRRRPAFRDWKNASHGVTRRRWLEPKVADPYGSDSSHD